MITETHTPAGQTLADYWAWCAAAGVEASAPLSVALWVVDLREAGVIDLRRSGDRARIAPVAEWAAQTRERERAQYAAELALLTAQH